MLKVFLGDLPLGCVLKSALQHHCGVYNFNLRDVLLQLRVIGEQETDTSPRERDLSLNSFSVCVCVCVCVCTRASVRVL